jgi:hypothetical protein
MPVFGALRVLYLSTLGLRVMKKKQKTPQFSAMSTVSTHISLQGVGVRVRWFRVRE